MSVSPSVLVSRAASLPLIFSLMWVGCDRFKKETPLEFKTEVAVRTNLIQSVSANGGIAPIRQVQVGSQISGTITELRVDFNSKVTEGDILAKIDPAIYERALARADADLANSSAGLALAGFNFKRAKELYSAKLISETEYQQADVSMQQSQAVVKMRQAALESAKVDLDRTVIYAPISGIVVIRNVDAGQTVAASFSTPTLFQIAQDLTRMQIELAVSEADIGTVLEKQRVEFTVDAFPSRKFDGLVRQVRFAPTTNQSVVTYTTVVDVDNRALRLRPGMTATATIVTSEKTNVVRIPVASTRFVPPSAVAVLPVANVVSTNDIVRSAMPGMEGMPVPPWTAEQRRPTDEERKKYEAGLTPAQKEQYQQLRDRMRAMMAAGGPPGGGMGGGTAGPGGGGGGGGRVRSVEGPTLKTVYVLKSGVVGATAVLQAVQVKVGMTDGNSAEVLEGLEVGAVVVTAIKPPLPPVGGSTPNPFGSPFGGGRR